jgi:CheY-like chemotaxis protein
VNDDKRRVLMVDDCVDDIHVLMENLKQDYAVLAATNGEKALEMAGKTPQPDVILMDVMMPGVDGYETCRRLKSDPNTQNIDIIFVSAHDTTEEKLTGYEAGGCDYLIKPVQPNELMQKVKLAVQNKIVRAEAAKEKEIAMQTAMTAISSAGEQGVVLDFMRRSFTTASISELARLIVEAVANYGLENSVQIRGSRELVNSSTTEPMSPLEQELILRLKDAGRIRENGKRFIANFGEISLLIKNMPEDEDKRGRLRDHLAMLLEGAESRLRALEMAHELEQTVQESNQALKNIQAVQKAHKEKAVQIMDDVMRNIEHSFLSYGLTEEQETLLLNIVQTGVNQSLDNLEQSLQADQQLHSIVERLERFSQICRTTTDDQD